MDFQQILNVLTAVRDGQNDENMSRLFGGFQELIELQLEYQSMMDQKDMPSKEDQMAIVEKMTANLGKLQKDYGDFCKKTGKSPEEMKDYFSNPKNFTPGAWEELQNFSRRLGVNESSPKIPKKKKKGSKRSKKWASI